jgi:hypothetical protein
MHASRLTLALAVFATLAAASAAGARSGLSVDVCRMLSAKEVTAIPGVSSKCTNAKPANGPGSTIYTANWAGTTPKSPSLQVTVSLYTDSGALQLAKRNLNQGLPGTPKRVTGIGSAAYEATGASSTGVQFNVGKYIASIRLTTMNKPQRSTAPIEAIAKAIARRL